MYRFTTLMMVFALATINQPVSAEPGEVAVRYSDLDLTRIEGTKVLYNRLTHAAQNVCSPDKRDPENAARFKECIQSAIEAAVAKIDRPMLTAYYQAKSHPGGAPIQVAAK
jgi:UrcA family protein